MSDHQPTDKLSEEPEIKGGWRKPDTAGGWRPVAPRPAEDKDAEGWRVPAMPANLQVAPTQEGTWHLPRPEDTTFTAEDEIEIPTTRIEALRPEDSLPDVQPAATQEAPTEDEDQESFGGLGELMMLVSQVEHQPPASIVLTAEEEQEEESALDFTGPAEAEREALASAVSSTETLPTGVISPAEMARLQIEQLSEEAAVEAEDAAAVARRQVEELAGETSAPTASAQTGVEDAAAVARRQVEELMGGTQASSVMGDFTPIQSAAPTIDPEQEALAQKFAETEVQVRALRQQYRAGQMTRDQLQEKLRQLLILDNDDVWWMMGVDTDTWYRFDSQVNDWVAATPPRPSAPPPSPPRTVTSEFTAAEVMQGALPYLPDDEVTSPSYHETGAYTGSEEDMVMPRSVPVDDPNYTVPSMSGIRLDDIRQSEAPTLNSTQPYSYGETQLTQPAVADVTTFAPAAGYDAAERPPDYNIGETGVQYQQAVELQRQSTMRIALLIGSLVIGGLFILGAIVVGLIVISYNNLASEYTTQVAALANYQPAFQTARILDARGNLLAELNSQQGGARKNVDLTEISPEMIYAVVASENERFFEDPGYDPIAIGRAFLQNFSAGSVVSGASTITQQIASRLILQDQGTPTADQKLREIVIASEIARRYDKNFILQLYMNEVFFGNQSYGVEAAAEFYFNKTAADLNLAESAMLASLIRSPAANDPVTNPAQAFNGMDQVLRRIATVPCLNFQHAPYIGRPFCITEGYNQIVNNNNQFAGQILIERAEVEARDYLPRASTVRYPHFVYFVLAQLERQFGSDEIFRRGFEVQTTLMPNVQDAAQKALTDMLGQITFTGVNSGTVMVTDPRDGAIRAMIGSPDFNNAEIDGQVNLALSWQQPGSAIKPFVYTAALEGVGDRNNNGTLDNTEYFTPATILWDVPTAYQNPAYTPVNFDGRFRGPVSVRYALANSINVAAVKAFSFIGADKFIDTARRLGLTFLQDPPQVTLASAVGATDVRLYDMMAAYGTLANTGRYVPLYAIISVKDANGNPVSIEPRPDPVVRVQPEVAFLMQNILSDNTARADQFGANSPLYIPEYGDRVAAKTGTSNDARDLWTMGFTRTAVVGVWLGRPDNAPTRGGSLEHAAPVWNATMRAILATMTAPEPFGSPGNIYRDDICVLTGAKPGDNCPGIRSELFVVSQPPPPADQGVVISVPIDTWTGLRANESCTENVEMRTFANISDPFAVQWLGTAAGQPIARQLGLPIPPLSPPTGACDINTIRPVARIASPVSGEVLQGVVSITGAVSVPQNFARYQIDILSVNNPNTVITSIGPFNNQVPNQAELGQWDTRQVPNGGYIVRLSVFATAQGGGGYLYRPVQVTVQNILPTSTPVILPTVPIPTATTIPIDLGGSSSQSLGAPTPTATINPGG
jgi:membrane peptidoglycan carboxypeptidase